MNALNPWASSCSGPGTWFCSRLRHRVQNPDCLTSGVPTASGRDATRGFRRLLRDWSGAWRRRIAAISPSWSCRIFGKLKFLISQNVDNLHLKSGIRPELLAELHGNITKLRCPNCGSVYDRSSGLRSCRCGGALASSTVDFGQPLPERDVMLSFEHSRKSDLFIVAGSSLVVTPAADMPKEALRAGAKLVIINEGPTPFDRLAHLRFHEKTGETLPKATARLKMLINRS